MPFPKGVSVRFRPPAPTLEYARCPVLRGLRSASKCEEAITRKVWSGGRISEVLALAPAAIDLDTGAANLLTLKRRKRGLVRQVLLPPELLRDLNRLFDLRRRQLDRDLATIPLWTWSRTTAWRRVKEVMATAGIAGAAAMPKGLRHSFGVNAFQSGVPPHLVQRWLGHASLETTAIYGDVIGPEERAFSAQMWRT